jgi:hypothetical protein
VWPFDPSVKSRPRFREFPTILRKRYYLEVAENENQQSALAKGGPTILAGGEYLTGLIKCVPMRLLTAGLPLRAPCASLLSGSG